MKPTYLFLILIILLSSCSRGYYSHIPRAKTHSTFKTPKPDKHKLKPIQVNILPTTIETKAIELIDLQHIEQVIVNDTTSACINIIQPPDSTKKYIHRDPSSGLRARTLSKIITPLALIFTNWFAGAVVDTLALNGFLPFGIGLPFALVMLLITLLVYYYQTKAPLFNRPAKKSKKITVLRIFMILGALLLLYFTIGGIVIFTQTTLIITGYNILLWPLSFLSLMIVMFSCYLWLEMLWQEFAY